MWSLNGSWCILCADTHVPRVQSAHFPMRASPIRCCRYRRWLLHIMWTFEFFLSNRLIQKQGCLVERKKTSYQKTKEDRQEVPLWTIIENFNWIIAKHLSVFEMDFQTIFTFNLKAFNELFISSELWISFTFLAVTWLVWLPRRPENIWPRKFLGFYPQYL